MSTKEGDKERSCPGSLFAKTDTIFASQVEAKIMIPSPLVVIREESLELSLSGHERLPSYLVSQTVLFAFLFDFVSNETPGF